MEQKKVDAVKLAEWSAEQIIKTLVEARNYVDESFDVRYTALCDIWRLLGLKLPRSVDHDLADAVGDFRVLVEMYEEDEMEDTPVQSAADSVLADMRMIIAKRLMFESKNQQEEF